MKKAETSLSPAMKPITIVFIASGVSMGGAEIALRDLLRFSGGQGVSSVVICKPGSYLETKLSSLENVEVISESIPSWRKLFSRLKFSSFIRGVAQDHKVRKANIVISNDFWTAPHCLALAGKLDCPALTIVQDSLLDGRKTKNYRLAQFETILTVSQTMEERLRLILPKVNIINIRGGVDTERFSPTVSGEGLSRELGLSKEDFVLLTVGRISPNKGQQLLVSSLTQLLKSHKHWKIVFAGISDTPEGKNIRRLAQENSIDQQLIFAGASDEMPQHLASCDVLVQLSSRESFGMAVAEGMALGKPVVYSDIPALRELCPDRESGLAVNRDDPEAICVAILNLYEDRNLRQRLGSRGRELILQRYSLQKKALRVFRVVQDMIAR